MCFGVIICVFVLLCVYLCLTILQFDSIPISSFRSPSGRLYANWCLNAISLTQQTLRNSEIGLTYLKYPLHSLEIGFEGFGVLK